jgi:tetratricopeptide (TPR) repeat protein
MTDRGALEDQRDFLLRSLEDLEREHEVGDVDEHDYLALKDDYTVRAAAVLRALDAGPDRIGVRSARRSPRRTAVVVGAVALLAVATGLLVAQAAGRRDPGEVATGGIRQSVTEKLNEAGRLSGDGSYAEAIDLYDEVLADDPVNVEALTYRGWVLTLSGQAREGLTSLLDAATADPTYPDVHAFLAIVLFRNGLVDQADSALRRLDALDPPAYIRELTSGLRTEIDAALADRATSTTAA